MARVIIGSLVAHAALLAVLDMLAGGAAKPAPPAPAAPAAPIEPVTPIDVVVLPAAAPPPLAPVPRSSRRPSTATTIATTTAPSSMVEAAPPATETPGPTDTITETPSGPSHSMWMRPGRGYRGPDLAIHEDVSHPDRPIEKPIESGKKVMQNGTEYVVPDLVTTMHVAADGRARFVDKPDIDVRVALPSLDAKQAAKDLGDHLAGWYRDPYAQKNARAFQDMPRHEQAVPGGWNAGAGGDTNIDGSIQQPEELPRKASGNMPILAGKLDITSWLHRKYIGDPYASRKRALLDGTLEERARIRARHTREQLDQSAVIMLRNVDRVFVEIADPVERRAALFALWDECAEGEAGDRARAIVIGAIRGRLSGAPDRFTIEEIAALDAQRTSSQHFVPYDD